MRRLKVIAAVAATTAGAMIALAASASAHVTVSRPEVFLGPGDIGIGQQLLAVLVTPFGASLPPVDVSV